MTAPESYTTLPSLYWRFSRFKELWSFDLFEPDCDSFDNISILPGEASLLLFLPENWFIDEELETDY